MTELQISFARYVFRVSRSIIGRMHTSQALREKLSTALRSRKAGFFKMKLSRLSSCRPAQDHNPLRRPLQ